MRFPSCRLLCGLILLLCVVPHLDLAAQEIREGTTVAPSDFVDLEQAVPGVVIDAPYATSENFLKRPVYPANKCYLRKPVAERLALVQKALEEQGLGLKIWDGYRPLSVQEQMWAILPDPDYVGNPQKGSRHNRGAAVDVTLVDKAGNELEMPTAFDDFTPAAHLEAKTKTKAAARNRQTLQQAMKHAGFLPLKTEWWHFDAPDWRNYPVANISFEDIDRALAESSD